MGLLEAIMWFKWISHLSNIKGSSFPEYLTKGVGLLRQRAAQVERNIQKTYMLQSPAQNQRHLPLVLKYKTVKDSLQEK